MTKIVPKKCIPTKTVPKDFNEKKVICTRENFCILLTFLIIYITITNCSIYCCFIKHQSKQ